MLASWVHSSSGIDSAASDSSMWDSWGRRVQWYRGVHSAIFTLVRAATAHLTAALWCLAYLTLWDWSSDIWRQQHRRARQQLVRLHRRFAPAVRVVHDLYDFLRLVFSGGGLGCLGLRTISRYGLDNKGLRTRREKFNQLSLDSL